jgi:ring-1,2-phenylacetyl-CoA epoxidase subunit PaaC
MYEKVQDLSPELRQDLADWLLTLADNKRVLGLRYAEWSTGAPELEADVTISAMAQYELGHARLLRGVLSGMEEDPRTEARATDPSTWRNLPSLDQPAAEWDTVVALNGLLDGLLTVNLESATNGGLVPLAQRLRKAVSEEQYHTLHAAAWFDRLADAPDELRARFASRVEQVGRECVMWFGPEGTDNGLDRLGAAGVLDTDAAGLRERFLDLIAPLLGDVDVSVAADDYADWDPIARRSGIPDFDTESFSMLTGAHARAMGVSD